MHDRLEKHRTQLLYELFKQRGGVPAQLEIAAEVIGMLPEGPHFRLDKNQLLTADRAIAEAPMREGFVGLDP